ncbi:hypothetical protein N8T08_006009 [Aspergillus melleus]|uniref:Uncharacterized protein n=1 Tax=Aspergillus melleus TaxID=138277 RepID=A0ACC3B0Q7_9EURO|nr:hypothetical protein N8T08_006009 [Aspergillus melleus]
MAVGNTQLAIDIVRMGPPRLDPYTRLLSRFYEPLFLLAALGQTRGEHTPKPPDLGLEHTQRRRFLRNLAYICDFQKGGASCTAIGLEDDATCYRFWVACNRADDQVLGFLSVALSHLKDFSDENSEDAEVDKTKTLAFVKFCLSFAESRIKNEIQLLYKAINECSSVPAYEESQEYRYLQDWVKSAPDKTNHLDFCDYVHRTRTSKFIAMLTMHARRQEELRGPGAKRSSFASVNHYMGRLASHIEAPRRLLEDARTVGQILESYQVCPIKQTESVSKPLPDSLTTMPGIVKRMLNKDDPERIEIERKLLYRNTQSGVFECFMKLYENCSPSVHAEIRVLEHFHRTNLSFVADDRYIACSKPACLCCQLYFKYHPARMVVPESHCKIWTNWGPPLVTRPIKNDLEFKRQRDILNQMIADLRRSVIGDILGNSPAHRWHPDSQTGTAGKGYIISTSKCLGNPDAVNTPVHLEPKTKAMVVTGDSNQLVESRDEGYQSEDGGIRI